MKQLFILGDSTAAHKEFHKKPESGWGEWIEHELIEIRVFNLAQNGRSSKSFFLENRHEMMEETLQKQDICLIQFGHNDQKKEDLHRYTTRDEYQGYLKRFVDLIKQKEAIPILLSSITRRHFIEGLINKNTLGEYPSYMKEFAEKEGIIFINMFQITQSYLQLIGEEASKKLYLHLKPSEHENYPHGVTDDTHLNEFGAKFIARMIVNELKKRDIV